MTARHPEPDRLQDYLDELLGREERAELEAHLDTCAECTAHVAGERELRRALAALPRSIAPERDLLAGINAAIDAADPVNAPHAAIDAAALPGPRARTRPRFAEQSIGSLRFALAAAALVLIALTAALTILLLRVREPAGLAVSRSAPGVPAPVTDLVVREVLAVEASYVEASDELETALAAARPELDAATVRLVEANLRVVESALAEARAALRREPDNAALAQLLRDAHEQKLALLRRATRAVT
jgi:anti-sigma factor RsiW